MTTQAKNNTGKKSSDKCHSFSMITHLSIWLLYHCMNHYCLKGQVLDLFYSLYGIFRMMLHLCMHFKHACIAVSYVQEVGMDFGDSFYNVVTEDLELNYKLIS